MTKSLCPSFGDAFISVIFVAPKTKRIAFGLGWLVALAFLSSFYELLKLPGP